MAIADQKIPIKVGVNDAPVAPTDSKGSNGAYLIAKFNDLIDELIILLDDIDISIGAINSLAASEKTKLSGLVTRVATLEGEVPPKDFANDISALIAEIATLKSSISVINTALASGGGTGGTGNTGGAVTDASILPDTFNAPDGTTLIGKKSAIGKPAWEKYLPNSSDGKIMGNALTEGSSGLFAVRNHGLSTYSVNAKVKGSSSAGNQAFSLYVRAQNDGSYQALVLQFVSGLHRVYRQNGLNGYHLIGGDITAALSSDTFANIEAKVSPTEVKVLLNGTLINTISETNYASHPYIGFALQGGVFSIDEITVT